MTLDDVKKMDREFLTPAEVASILKCRPQNIRALGELAPEKLGFNFCFVGNRMKIPRVAFVKWMEGGNGQSPDQFA